MKFLEDVVVLVRGGSYQPEKTVVFGLKDSGQGRAVRQSLTLLTLTRNLFSVPARKSGIGNV